MKTNLKLLVAGEQSVTFARTRLPEWLNGDWKIDLWLQEQGEVDFRSKVADAAVLVGQGFGDVDLRDTPLQLLHVPFAGYDWVRRDLLPADCLLCNTYEHEIPIAEYVMLAILEWEFRLFETVQEFRGGSWRRCMPAAGPFHGEAHGKTLGLVGYGHIGKAIASRAAAFGMRSIAIVPSERATPEPLDWIDTTENGLHKLLQESDYLVVTCPLNEQTRGLIGPRELAGMKSNALLINVARGAVVEEQALYAALKNRIIGGAVIDTWYRYPFEPGNDNSVAPSAHPYHELDNLYMTPHCSAWTLPMVDRRWRFITANLERFAAGETLANVICGGPA